MVTDGNEVGPDIALTGEYDILLLRSENGSLNSTVVKNAMICLKRYLAKIPKNNENISYIQYPVLLIFTNSEPTPSKFTM